MSKTTGWVQNNKQIHRYMCMDTHAYVYTVYVCVFIHI